MSYLKSNVIGIMVVIILIVILIQTLSSPSCHDNFTYNQEVTIISGFYKGMKGKLVSKDEFKYEIVLETGKNIGRISCKELQYNQQQK